MMVMVMAIVMVIMMVIITIIAATMVLIVALIIITMVTIFTQNNFLSISSLPVYGDLVELRGRLQTIQSNVVQRYSERMVYYTLHHVNIYYHFQYNFVLRLTGLDLGVVPLDSLELCVFCQ